MLFIPLDEVKSFILKEIAQATSGVLLDVFFILLKERGRPTYEYLPNTLAKVLLKPTQALERSSYTK